MKRPHRLLAPALLVVLVSIGVVAYLDDHSAIPLLVGGLAGFALVAAGYISGSLWIVPFALAPLAVAGPFGMEDDPDLSDPISTTIMALYVVPAFAGLLLVGLGFSRLRR
jgi:hypothetical protein